MPCDPNPLTTLGQAVLHQGSALAVTSDGRTLTLASGPVHCPFCLNGLRAGPGVEAAAFPLSWDGHSPSSAISVRRSGEMLVAARQAGLPDSAGSLATLVVVDHNALVVDLARRIMGLPTSPAPASTTSLHDTLWLDRMVETCLAAPIGEAPPLAQLLALHPSANGRHRQSADGAQATMTTEALRHLRSRSSADWSRLHAEACDHGVAWAGIGPALASWFDPGSLARWLFSMLPEPEAMLDELGELVGPAARRSISEVLRCPLSA